MDGTSARAVLGLAPAATRHDIKRAFRARAKQTHPDTGGSSADFARLTSAYETALRSSGSPAATRFLRAGDLAPAAPRWMDRSPRPAPRSSTGAPQAPSFKELLAAAMAA